VSSVQIVANFLYSRILMRFPTLKVVFAETSLSWGAYEIETADHQFERQRLHLEGYDMTPSQMFHRQCYMTGWYDRTAIEARQYLGVDNILWSTNFPQATSTWPTTRETIAKSFAGVPEDERAKMLWGNAAQLYKL
jgi:predicted TIM-barrel fold metal-dependent hydrolase